MLEAIKLLPEGPCFKLTFSAPCKGAMGRVPSQEERGLPHGIKLDGRSLAHRLVTVRPCLDALSPRFEFDIHT